MGLGATNSSGEQEAREAHLCCCSWVHEGNLRGGILPPCKSGCYMNSGSSNMCSHSNNIRKFKQYDFIAFQSTPSFSLEKACTHTDRLPRLLQEEIILLFHIQIQQRRAENICLELPSVLPKRRTFKLAK